MSAAAPVTAEGISGRRGEAPPAGGDGLSDEEAARLPGAEDREGA
ncbi:hypothetical protein [Streptomyces sp. NPDC006638]